MATDSSILGFVIRSGVFLELARSAGRCFDKGAWHELEKLLGPKGINTIYCDDLSLQGQARAFSEASVIVLPHGAQLANLAFAKPGAKVVLFEYKNISEYEALCQLAGLECHKIITPQVEGATV